MKIKTILLLLIATISGSAQEVIEYKGEKINALDSNGNQTGIWKLFDEAKSIMITTEFLNGKKVSDTKYYKDSILIAAYKSNNILEIYKDNQTIYAHFFRKTDGSQTLLNSDNIELDSELLRYFYLSAEVKPMYYGGITQLYDFIGKNVDYNAIKKNKGRVKVKFIIDKHGTTGEIQVLESSNSELNNEAMRIVSILPRWQPGHQGGDFVNVSYVIPIVIN